MPYDPTLPLNNAQVQAALLRGQFNGLKDLIDTIPVGPPGQNGSDGTSVTGAIIDGTNTLNPGDAAQASVSWDGANVRFTFGIPRGQDGQAGQDGVSSPPITSFIVDGVNTLTPGEPATANASFDGSAVRLLFGIPRGSDGTNGSNGNDGGQGPPGAPFTNFMVDGVTTLNPTDPATVSVGFDGTAVRLLFGIPRGSEGVAGSMGPAGPPFGNALVDGVTTLNPGEAATVQTSFDGSNVRFQFGIPRGFPGNDGGSGPQGSPGEVTTMQLNSAISGTSSNSNAVATLDTPFADPDAEAMRLRFNELVLALRR